MSVQAYALKWAVRPNTIRLWVRQGRLPAARVGAALRVQDVLPAARTRQEKSAHSHPAPSRAIPSFSGSR